MVCFNSSNIIVLRDLHCISTNANYFSIYQHTSGAGSFSGSANWKVSGFLASGQYNTNYKQIIKY